MKMKCHMIDILEGIFLEVSWTCENDLCADNGVLMLLIILNQNTTNTINLI